MARKGPHPRRRWKLIRQVYAQSFWTCFEETTPGSWMWAGTEAEVHF